MAIDIKNILRLAPALQSAALVGKNLELVRKRKKTAKDFVEFGATSIIGTALIKEQADFIEGI